MGRWSENYKDGPILEITVMPVEGTTNLFDVIVGQWSDVPSLECATEDQVREFLFKALIEDSFLDARGRYSR